MAVEIKSAQIFPGQGLASQEIIDYYHQLLKVSRYRTQNYIVRTQKALDKFHGAKTFDLKAALEDKDSSHFGLTSFVQPVVYTLSVLTSEIADAKGSERITPHMVAGHSLGEYSALTKAGVISFKNGLEIITFRGLVMQEACQDNPSSLVSINGLNEELVKDKICQQTGAEIALINAPTLIVVGISKDGVADVEKLAQEAGARRVSTLPTAGAFHTHFMQKASEKLDKFIAGYEFFDPQIPVVTNLTGEVSNSGRAIKHHQVEVMINPVRWAKGIQTMRDAQVTTFAETGPGKSLAALNRINGVPEEQTISILESLRPAA